MKHLFIVNPAAGGKDCTEAVRGKVEAAFRTREDPYEIYVTKAPMDAQEKIRAEAASGEAAVYDDVEDLIVDLHQAV